MTNLVPPMALGVSGIVLAIIAAVQGGRAAWPIVLFCGLTGVGLVLVAILAGREER